MKKIKMLISLTTLVFVLIGCADNSDDNQVSSQSSETIEETTTTETSEQSSGPEAGTENYVPLTETNDFFGVFERRLANAIEQLNSENLSREDVTYTPIETTEESMEAQPIVQYNLGSAEAPLILYNNGNVIFSLINQDIEETFGVELANDMINIFLRASDPSLTIEETDTLISELGFDGTDHAGEEVLYRIDTVNLSIVYSYSPADDMHFFSTIPLTNLEGSESSSE